MAQIAESSSKQPSKRKRHLLKLDMTPMVDLAFLLLTFFVLAASLVKPKTIEIIYPADGPSQPVNENHVTTLLLGDKPGEIAYYQGLFDLDTTKLIFTNFSSSGFRNFLSTLNKDAILEIVQLQNQRAIGQISDENYSLGYRQIANKKNAPVVIVKTMKKTKYAHVISAIDELNIADVRKRVIQDMSESEILLLTRNHN